MAYNRQRNVEDGEVLVGEGNTGVTKGPLVHGEDTNGKARPLKVSDDGFLETNSSISPPPVTGTPNRARFFGGYLGSSGVGLLSDSLVNMNVNGSVSPKTFYVGANPNYDIHITQIQIVIVGNDNVKYRKFGSGSTLTNGWDLEIYESSVASQLISKAKTNGEIITQSGFSNPFGSESEVFILDDWGHHKSALVVSIEFSKWIPGGLRIGRGTTDQLRSIVNDNLTSTFNFYVKLFGFKNYST